MRSLGLAKGRCGVDEEHSIVDGHLVARDVGRVKVETRSGCEHKSSTVPRADDIAVFDRATMDFATHVGAVVVERVKLRTVSDDTQFPAFTVDNQISRGLELFNGPCSKWFTHPCSFLTPAMIALPRSKPGLTRLVRQMAQAR